MGGPLSSEFGANKTVKTRFWLWLEPGTRLETILLGSLRLWQR